MMAIFKQHWPWWISGPLIGLMVPVLLLIGNKAFGLSSSLRHICAACFPANIPLFTYDWKREGWNLFFAAIDFIFASGYCANTNLAGRSKQNYCYTTAGI